MLHDTEWLGRVLGAPVTDVTVGPYEPNGWSATNSLFESVCVTLADGSQRQLVMKTSTWDSDWMMQGTTDRLCRAARVWEHGILDRVPDLIDHATVAAWADSDGRQCILMRDAREDLLGDNAPVSVDHEHLVLRGMAALHAEFFQQDPGLEDPGLGLCSPRGFYKVFAPDVAGQWPRGTSVAMDMVADGWRLLDNFVDADVARLLRALAEDPTPLTTALWRYPTTLVHGDLRTANLGIVPGDAPRLLVLDWARVACAPPAVDLGWHLATSRDAVPWSRDEVINVYREKLACALGDRFDPAWWEPQLRLALLGSAAQFAGLQSWFAHNHEEEAARRADQDDLAGWWSDQVRAALPLLPDLP